MLDTCKHTLISLISLAVLQLIGCGKEEKITPPLAPITTEKTKVVFIGDSITDIASHEDGYQNYVTMIQAARPDLDVISKGKGGNTSQHLLDRWDHDIIQENPAVVVILVGINDADYKIRYDDDNYTNIAYYTRLKEMVRRTRDALPGTRIILIDPFMIYRSADFLPTDFHRAIAVILPGYISFANRAAKESNVEIVSVTEALYNVNYPADIAPDSVHPSLKGHQIIAAELLKHL